MGRLRANNAVSPVLASNTSVSVFITHNLTFNQKGETLCYQQVLLGVKDRD
jgi:hypothetical protein